MSWQSHPVPFSWGWESSGKPVNPLAPGFPSPPHDAPFPLSQLTLTFNFKVALEPPAWVLDMFYALRSYGYFRRNAAQDETLSLADAAAYLAASLTDPLSSTSCHLRMRVAAERTPNVLRSRTTDSARRQVIRAYPQVLRAGIEFLTRNQPRAAHDSMVRHLCDCRVHRGRTSKVSAPPRIYDEGRRCSDAAALHPNHHLVQVVRTIVDCITSTLSATTIGKFSSEQGSGDNQPWPASADDLLPNGCADSVDAYGLDLWASEPNGHIVYSVASCLAMFHAPFDRATFEPPFRPVEAAKTSRHCDVRPCFRLEQSSLPLHGASGHKLYSLPSLPEQSEAILHPPSIPSFVSNGAVLLPNFTYWLVAIACARSFTTSQFLYQFAAHRRRAIRQIRCPMSRVLRLPWMWPSRI
ncbi:hypothetical protein NMY22_g9374 [Coprinellus aureogranulatus]|nr:hypothetical protein NMY22_g9374 [Coprinellus aureogranulatus]